MRHLPWGLLGSERGPQANPGVIDIGRTRHWAWFWVLDRLARQQFCAPAIWLSVYHPYLGVGLAAVNDTLGGATAYCNVPCTEYPYGRVLGSAMRARSGRNHRSPPNRCPADGMGTGRDDVGRRVGISSVEHTHPFQGQRNGNDGSCVSAAWHAMQAHGLAQKAEKRALAAADAASREDWPSLSRDLPVVVGVAVSPKLPILMGPCGGAPAVAQPRDMHVSLSLLLVSAP